MTPLPRVNKTGLGLLSPRGIITREVFQGSQQNHYPLFGFTDTSRNTSTANGNTGAIPGIKLPSESFLAVTCLICLDACCLPCLKYKAGIKSQLQVTGAPPSLVDLSICPSSSGERGGVVQQGVRAGPAWRGVQKTL